MNRKITVAKVKAKRLGKKARAALNRNFNITLSLKRKKDPEHPLFSLNLKGEIPREVVALFALLGALTCLCAVFRLIRKIFG